MCVTSLGRPYEKYVKGDVIIRDSLKKVSQRGLGSHRPHGTTAGLKYFCLIKLILRHISDSDQKFGHRLRTVCLFHRPADDI
jgi:hypothetical protein